MAENKLLGRVFAERVRLVLQLRVIQSIQISTVQGCDNGIAEIREDVSETEG